METGVFKYLLETMRHFINQTPTEEELGSLKSSPHFQKKSWDKTEPEAKPQIEESFEEMIAPKGHVKSETVVFNHPRR